MGSYDPLQGHAVHATLNNLLLLEGAKEFTQAHYGIEPPHAYAIMRTFSVAHDAKLIISKLDARTVNTTALDGLNNGLSNALNELNAFKSNGNTAHLDNAHMRR